MIISNSLASDILIYNPELGNSCSRIGANLLNAMAEDPL